MRLQSLCVAHDLVADVRTCLAETDPDLARTHLLARAALLRPRQLQRPRDREPTEPTRKQRRQPSEFDERPRRPLRSPPSSRRMTAAARPRQSSFSHSSRRPSPGLSRRMPQVLARHVAFTIPSCPLSIPSFSSQIRSTFHLFLPGRTLERLLKNLCLIFHSRIKLVSNPRILPSTAFFVCFQTVVFTPLPRLPSFLRPNDFPPS